VIQQFSKTETTCWIADRRTAPPRCYDIRSAAGRLVLNVLASVSQWEREAIGERTSAALQYKAAQGQYCGGRVPYGYRLAADCLEPEPTALATAKRLRAAGFTLAAVSQQLAAQGFKSRVGKQFAPIQIARMVA